MQSEVPQQGVRGSMDSEEQPKRKKSRHAMAPVPEDWLAMSSDHAPSAGARGAGLLSLLMRHSRHMQIDSHCDRQTPARVSCKDMPFNNKLQKIVCSLVLPRDLPCAEHACRHIRQPQHAAASGARAQCARGTERWSSCQRAPAAGPAGAI